MKKKIRYEMLPYQREFHESRKSKAFMSTGYGGGKTYSLCMKGLQLADINGKLPGGILAPNLKMFKRDVWPTFKDIASKYRFKVEFNKVDSVLYLPTTKTEIFVFHAEDAGESIRGPNIAWGLINEVTLIDRASFDAFLARIRIKAATLRQLAMSGTPEGFTWHYEYFIENPRADTDLIFGDMRLNRFVADDYAKTLTESYDELLAQQFVEGKFINTNGKAAVYAFDRRKHTRTGLKRQSDCPVWVSIDFNVAPMSATIWSKLPDNDRGEPFLIGFDEIKIDNSDTPQIARAIKEKVGTEDVVLFPDPAGNQRRTSASKTDIQILRDAGFTDIRYKPSIKSVRDTLVATNSFFAKNKAVLDSEKCKNAIADLEQVTIKAGTNELDKSNPARSHWVDGIKNMIHFEYPITAGAGSWRETRIR